MSAVEELHPALRYHIVNTLGWTDMRPTQLEAIRPIQSGENVLLLAPTAGGKRRRRFRCSPEWRTRGGAAYQCFTSALCALC